MFKLTYIFRLLFGLPLCVVIWLGEQAERLHVKLCAVTWAPERKR